MFAIFLPGTQRSFCAVSHLYNVTRPSGAKNNRKTKIGCYLATQMKITIIPSSHSGRGQSQRRAEGRFHADTWRERGAFSDKSSERILGKSEAVCRWKHDGPLDPGRDKRGGVSETSLRKFKFNRAEMFDEIPRDRNRFSAARIECTEEGALSTSGSAIQRRVML